MVGGEDSVCMYERNKGDCIIVRRCLQTEPASTVSHVEGVDDLQC